MQLTAEEMIAFSVSPRFEPIWPQCACGQDAYRIVGVFDRGLRKETPLCACHFIEACVNYPLLSYVEGGSGLGFHNLKQPVQPPGFSANPGAHNETPTCLLT